MTDVKLTWAEVKRAAIIGIDRIIFGCVKSDGDRHGLRLDGSLGSEEDIRGAIAECAVAKHLGLYWSGGEPSGPDMGTDIDVKSVAWAGHRLMLHHDSHDHWRYVLVTVHRDVLPWVKINGWIDGRSGKRDEYWSDPGTGRPAFFVPNAVLIPIEELIP